MKAPDLTGRGGRTISSSGNANGKERNTTGRYTLVFRRDATDAGVTYLRSAGFNVFVSNADDPKITREDQVPDVDVIVYPKLGVATVDANPARINELKNAASTSASPIMMVKAEKVRRLIRYSGIAEKPVVVGGPVSLDYLKGCRDTFDTLVNRLGSNGDPKAKSTAIAVADFDESQSTWGLQATGVLKSPFSGKGIKVAILDTGIYFTDDENGNIQYHKDFKGRSITMASFVPGAPTARDGHGHGTHCIGTACGARYPTVLPGYGVANEAAIYAGKVLDDDGSGADGWILAGIEWAINQGCRVVSMSLGATKMPGDTFNEAYEEIARRALAAGTVIIAAAGNDSARPDMMMPVNGPADCPSIVAVAAVDSNFRVASFSNAGINGSGGEVNIAAPGVNVYSSYLDGYERLQGTSMATPHVAGIAALFAEANSNLSGEQLRDTVVKAARALSLGPRDVGVGLAQAPIQTAGRAENTEVTGRAEQPTPVDRPMRILQSSPITVGGGGSVGIDFDSGRYAQVGAGHFASSQERLTTCQVIHQNGRLLRNFFPEINGNQCIVLVKCPNADGSGQESVIRVAGGPSGQMALTFSEGDFIPGVATQPRRYSATRKVRLVEVVNSATGASTPFEVPADFAGTVVIDN